MAERGPLAVDLFCGLGGWAEGFLAEGYEVTGYDIERHDYGTGGYPGKLVIQDVLTLDGAQFTDAACIVASPPCTEYSYMAMPWSRGKQIARALRGLGDFPEGYIGSRTVEQLNALFNACFRIQREASEAAKRHIPMVVENVRGAQPWVGRAAWNYGSYYLWGDVPALMPFPQGRKQPGRNFHFHEKYGITSPSFHGAPHEKSVQEALKLKPVGPPTPHQVEKYNCHINEMRDAHKGNGSWFGDYQEAKAAGRGAVNRYTSSKSPQRKAASALIAKIPFALARHIAAAYTDYPITLNDSSAAVARG